MGNMKKLTGAALALTMLLGGTPIWAQTDDSSTSTDVDKSPDHYRFEAEHAIRNRNYSSGCRWNGNNDSFIQKRCF